MFDIMHVNCVNRSASMKKNWNALETLKHSRHDWLNKLQLIKGNLALNKKDRVNQIIDEIVMNAKHESNLTNLKADNFATHLMTFNWENHHFIIEYEVLGEIRDLSSYDVELSEWFQRFFQVLNDSIKGNGNNHLSVSIDLTQKKPRFFLDFSGIIINRPLMIDWLEKESNSRINLDTKHIDGEELSVIFNLKEDMNN